MVSQQSCVPSLARRRFLQAGATAGAGIAFAGLPGPLAGVQGIAGAAAGPKSLVCIFLAGGADSCNMFIPAGFDQQGSTYATYARTRGSFAVPSADILEVGDGDFGMHPELPGIAALANAGKAAAVSNVGPIRMPTTSDDVAARRALPQSLFAHDAQQKLWQTGRTVLADNTGWGGSIAAVLANSKERPDDRISPAFSVDGSNHWQSSPSVGYSRLSPTVPIARLRGYDSSLRSWIPSFEGVEAVMHKGIELAAASPRVFDRAAAAATSRAVLTTEALQEATLDSEANDVGMDDIGQNRLGRQLQLVARLIKNREQIGTTRQTFFVRMGGWDTHGGQDERFPVLLRELDQAVTSFQTALEELGVEDSVTTFTASDFGRTLTSNGDGTDHGWGGHAMVIGGAVVAGRYGTFPSYASEGNPDDAGGDNGFAGRLIPTTSVSQYGATMARWIGLSDAEISQAFPDLVNFSETDLGFLR